MKNLPPAAPPTRPVTDRLDQARHREGRATDPGAAGGITLDAVIHAWQQAYPPVELPPEAPCFGGDMTPDFRPIYHPPSDRSAYLHRPLSIAEFMSTLV